jgi:nitrate reductase (NAD(P)H)
MNDPVAGNQPGGWMQRMKDEGLDPAKPIFTKTGSVQNPIKQKIPEIIMTKPGVNRQITSEELAHRLAEEAWFVVNGEVIHSRRSYFRVLEAY